MPSLIIAFFIICEGRALTPLTEYPLLLRSTCQSASVVSSTGKSYSGLQYSLDFIALYHRI